MSKITKAVIPAGGFGTRFLPATKAVPKEMFPLGNKPIIHHIVDELIEAGIKDITIIVSQSKTAIEQYFSANLPLENFLSSRKKGALIRELKNIQDKIDISYVYTAPPFGNGGCLKHVQRVVGQQPFVVVWGDETFISNGEKNRIQQCMEVYDEYQLPVVAVSKIENKNFRTNYGMAQLETIHGKKDVKMVTKIVEKPLYGKEPSPYAVLGTYILTPQYFNALGKTKAGINGEIWIADVLNVLMKDSDVLARIITDSTYLDCGVPERYFLSQIEHAFHESDNKKSLRKEIEKILARY